MLIKSTNPLARYIGMSTDQQEVTGVIFVYAGERREPFDERETEH